MGRASNPSKQYDNLADAINALIETGKLVGFIQSLNSTIQNEVPAYDWFWQNIYNMHELIRNAPDKKQIIIDSYKESGVLGANGECGHTEKCLCITCQPKSYGL
jgi:hypothetical protein